MCALRISILADYLNVDHNIRQSTKIDFTGPLDNLHCDTHSKNVVLYSRLSVLVQRSYNELIISYFIVDYKKM